MKLKNNKTMKKSILFLSIIIGLLTSCDEPLNPKAPESKRMESPNIK